MGTKINEARVADVVSAGQIEEALEMICDHGINRHSKAALEIKAMCLLRKRKIKEAAQVINKAIRIHPDGRAFKMLGDANFLNCEYMKSREAYARAMQLNPKNPDITHDYGVTFLANGEVDEAIHWLREAIKLAPDRPDFHHHLAIVLVLGGYEKEGWEEMVWRMQVPGTCGSFPEDQKYWKGQPLKGKRIVVRAEQGFGDTIQFARYVQNMHEAGAEKIYFYCQPVMSTFLEHYFPYVTAWPNIAPPPLDFDYHVNVMCLPRFFPDAQPPKTRPEGTKVGEGIGFCWFGSPTHKNDHLRTIGLEQWLPFFSEYPQHKWYTVAYGRFFPKPDNVHYLVDNCRDWKETAEQVKKLKLIITVDTAIAHLGGFLGIPTWLLLPYVPDFRWGMKGTTTKWYDSIRIFRQPGLFDWTPVWNDVRQAMKDEFGEGVVEFVKPMQPAGGVFLQATPTKDPYTSHPVIQA